MPQQFTEDSDYGLAFASAFQATIWGYPLAIMGATSRLITQATEPRPNAHSPMNQLGHSTRVYTADDRDVVSPNSDTAYSSVFLDLRQGAALFDMPEEQDRYHSLQLMDAYTNVIGYIGTRATGGRAGRYLIVGPGWAGKIPEDIQQVFHSPTPLTWVVGRTLVDGANDVEALVSFQKSIGLTIVGPASHPEPMWTRTGLAPLPPAPPAKQLAAMTADGFMDWLGRLMVDNPPPEAHMAHVAQFAACGLDGQRGFSSEQLSDAARAGLQQGHASAMRSIEDAAKRPAGASVNGWNQAPAAGLWGHRFAVRAMIAHRSLGQNSAQESIYLDTKTDDRDAMLDGTHTYRLRLEPNQLPPVESFWSVTAYDADNFLVPNEIDRFSLGSRSNSLRLDDDGGLTLVFSSRMPQDAKDQGNWLPTPPSGPFRLSMRLYIPSSRATSGSWVLPGLVKCAPNEQ